MNITFLLKK